MNGYSSREAVFERFLRQDPEGVRFGAVSGSRSTRVLDGPRTMRFRCSDLRKTEKTHVGTIVEIDLGEEFDLADGDKMDYSVAGHDVDCKYSMLLGMGAHPGVDDINARDPPPEGRKASDLHYYL